MYFHTILKPTFELIKLSRDSILFNMLSRFFDRTTHSVPLFEEDQSRRHHDVPIWKLNIQGYRARVRHSGSLKTIGSFVQFLGFPRSGHSLIGSVLDAHPQSVISHELDTMGLIQKNIPEKNMYGLIIENSMEFTKNGRYWNGFPYVVPGQPHGQSNDLRVIGDKKGDLAVRRYKDDTGLLGKMAEAIRTHSKWILVTRNPLDNIATMSLRKNRTYDRLRITTKESGDFKKQLKEHQRADEIASRVDDDMISDYASLCEGISEMSREISKDDLYHIVYEDFCADPTNEIVKLCDFLNLDRNPAFINSCVSIILSSLNKSRNKISWSSSQHERVKKLVNTYGFLTCYESNLELDG